MVSCASSKDDSIQEFLHHPSMTEFEAISLQIGEYVESPSNYNKSRPLHIGNWLHSHPIDVLWD